MGCRRTFSDLTGTAFANLARADLWLDFEKLLREGRSVREVAATLGIAKDTAFRWRHRFLTALRLGDRRCVSGTVEVLEVPFRFSEKGRRDLGRAPRRRGGLVHARPARERAYVLMARDRDDAAVAEVACLGRPSATILRRVLRPRLRVPCTILVGEGPASSYGAWCAEPGLTLCSVRPSWREFMVAGVRMHLGNVQGQAQRLKRWIRRFRGVATRYLPNYLRLHLFLEALHGPPRDGYGSVSLVATAAGAPWFATDAVRQLAWEPPIRRRLAISP